jgi:hypothetical protein
VDNDLEDEDLEDDLEADDPEVLMDRSRTPRSTESPPPKHLGKETCG